MSQQGDDSLGPQQQRRSAPNSASSSPTHLVLLIVQLSLLISPSWERLSVLCLALSAPPNSASSSPPGAPCNLTVSLASLLSSCISPNSCLQQYHPPPAPLVRHPPHPPTVNPWVEWGSYTLDDAALRSFWECNLLKFMLQGPSAIGVQRTPSLSNLGRQQQQHPPPPGYHDSQAAPDGGQRQHMNPGVAVKRQSPTGGADTNGQPSAKKPKQNGPLVVKFGGGR